MGQLNVSTLSSLSPCLARRLGCNDVSLPVFTVVLMYVAALTVFMLTLRAERGEEEEVEEESVPVALGR